MCLQLKNIYIYYAHDFYVLCLFLSKPESNELGIVNKHPCCIFEISALMKWKLEQLDYCENKTISGDKSIVTKVLGFSLKSKMFSIN